MSENIDQSQKISAQMDQDVATTDTTSKAKPPVVYHVKDVIAILGLGKTCVYELLRSHKLRSKKVGKVYLIPAEALDAYLHDYDTVPF